MKRFLLALLMAGITLVVVDEAHGYFYVTYHYYDNPELLGHPCGAFISYCEQGPYWEGCVTPYYVVYYGGCGGGNSASMVSAGRDSTIFTMMTPVEEGGGHGSCAPLFSKGL